MKLPAVVIDANVVVSGILTSERSAPTARILDAMLGGQIEFIVSIDLLAEYRRVLPRPKIQKRHGLSAEEVDTILTKIAEAAMVREPAVAGKDAPDPGDDHLWALLAAVPGAIFVTGDVLLAEKPLEGRSVITPRAFVQAWNPEAPRSPPTKF